MNNRLWIAFAIGIAVVSIVVIRLPGDTGDTGEKPPSLKPAAYHHEQVIRYRFALTNTRSELLQTVGFKAFMLVADSSFQQMKTIETSYKKTREGNPAQGEWLAFTFEHLPPYASKNITITARLMTSPQGNETAITDSAYLLDAQYLDIHSPEIQQAAARFKKTDAITATGVQAKRTLAGEINTWLHHHIKDIGYVAEDRGARYALKQRKGDCTEYMYAFVAIARALGIPARGVAGFVVNNKTAVVGSGDYYNWAEFYDGRQWVIADPQNHRLAPATPHYIAFNYLGGKSAMKPGNSQRFLKFDPRLNVVMN